MDLTAESLNLRPAGKTGPDEFADEIFSHHLDKQLLMLRQMWSRTNHAHVSEQHIYKLGQLIHAESPQPGSGQKNAGIVFRGLLRFIALMHMHRPVFEHFERSSH